MLENAKAWLFALTWLALPCASCGGGGGPDVCQANFSPRTCSSDACRLHPESCGGAAGSICDADHECAPQLFCCKERANCGGGMCTLKCADDRDCPFDMLCVHHMCFYACTSDRDCAERMTCEHDNTICEYK